MAQATLKNFEDFPLVLTARDIMQITGLSKQSVYQLFKREDFPAIECGRRLLVSREAFRQWLENR